VTDRVLIDSNIWIDCFRNKKSSNVEHVISLIRKSEGYICRIILAELFVGAKSDKESTLIEEYSSGLNILETTTNDYINAGVLGCKMRKNGITIPLPDLIIAEICIVRDLSIYTTDKHFDIICKYSKLKKYISPQ